MKSLFTLIFFCLLVLLIPAMAAAHSASGPCVDCHTMHASQDGSTSTPQSHLLRMSCVGCHYGGTNDLATGRGGPVNAPQVADSVTPLAGGYFTEPNQDSLHHNVSDTLPIDLAFSVIPGSGTTYDAGTQVGCTLCHDLSIGHSAADATDTGTATSSYRMLNGPGVGFYVAGTGDANYEVGATRNTYDAASMNLFCASCHGLFHALANTDSVGDGSGAWLRHPTDITINTYGANYDGTNKAVPVGDEGGVNHVMCISCHRPHGSAANDMLRFSYDGTGNLADDGIQSLGCETCHGAY